MLALLGAELNLFAALGTDFVAEGVATLLTKSIAIWILKLALRADEHGGTSLNSRT